MVNADAFTHELLSPNTALGQQIVDLFGKNVLRNGEFDRRAIGEIAFKDPETLHELERLLHPAVLRKIEEFYQQAQKQGGYSLFIVEIPLLYEIGQEDFYDAVIAVLSSEKNAKQRFKQAGFSDEEWERRMKFQLSQEEKANRANFVIRNDETLEDLHRQVDRLNKRLSSHES